MGEFDLISRLTARAGARADIALGIGDDAALLQSPAGEQLVACCDALNEGVHFLAGTDAGDIGWKSLAVNLSDLAAMGARPAWTLLSLSLPRADREFVDDFIEGFHALAAQAEVALVGGDTTSGPLSICVTALGLVPPGRALRRDGAQVGDLVCVSGTLGDAAAALNRARAGAPVDSAAARALQSRMRRPTPRLALGLALRGVAHAAIDVSDGLLADLGHIARASAVGLRLEAATLPASEALRALFPAEDCLRFQAIGGDDYELAFTLPPQRLELLRALGADLGVEVSVIGRVVAGAGVRLETPDGAAIDFGCTGWEHFTGSPP